MNVDLYTNDGTALVATVTIEPLIIPAEVVTWGTRMFVRQLDGSYREGISAEAQSVVLPATGYLGGIKNKDGF